jgi:hypothetical protein
VFAIEVRTASRCACPPTPGGPRRHAPPQACRDLHRRPRARSEGRAGRLSRLAA